MKFSAFRLGLLTLFSYFMFACNKNNNQHSVSKQTKTTLSLSASSVQRGQPLIASLPSGTSAAGIRWSVSPASAVHITPGNGQAMVLFPSPGHYTVTASYNGSDSSSTDSCSGTVTVSDSIAGPPPIALTYDTVSLAGDQLKITPTGDSAGDLILLVNSVNVYDCFPTFIYSLTEGPGAPGPIVFHPTNVVSGTAATPCNGARNPATAYLFIDPQSGNWLPNGTYPFSVILGNVTYSGTLVIANDSFTFNWSYSSGVTISPLRVGR